MSFNDILQLIAVAAIVVICVLWAFRRYRKGSGSCCDSDSECSSGCSGCPLADKCGKKSELTSDMLSGIEFQMRRSGIAVSDHTYLGGDALAHRVGMAYHAHLFAS